MGFPYLKTFRRISKVVVNWAMRKRKIFLISFICFFILLYAKYYFSEKAVPLEYLHYQVSSSEICRYLNPF